MYIRRLSFGTKYINKKTSALGPRNTYFTRKSTAISLTERPPPPQKKNRAGVKNNDKMAKRLPDSLQKPVLTPAFSPPLFARQLFSVTETEMSYRAAKYPIKGMA